MRNKLKHVSWENARSTLLWVGGLGLMSAAASQLHVAFGLAVGGVACLVLDWRVSE